ncbi:MAG: DUF4139 domain-containing protein, partial [Chloroflexota bacterium]
NAQVSQSTGERWEQVELTLSTAQVAVSQQLPELKTWYFSRYRFTAPKADSLRVEADSYHLAQPPAFEEYVEYNAGSSAPRKPALPSQAQIQQAIVQSKSDSSVSVNYKIATPVTITGNGEPHKTTVVITGMGVELDYFTIPRLVEDVYLRATIENTSEYTLLSGEVNIFHESDFVGKTVIDTIPPGKAFKVQLGQEDRITVTHEQVNLEANKRFLGRRKQTDVTTHITIQNLLQKTVAIVVQDHYPKSDEAYVSIHLDEETTTPPSEHTDLHILTWERTLEMGAEETIVLAYSVQT